MWDSIIKPTLVLFIVCVVIAGSLAYVNSITIDTIQQNTLIEQEEFRRQVLKEAQTFEQAQQKGIAEEVKGIYTGFAGDDPVGYVVEVVSKGYGGAISMTVGVNMEGVITGIVIGSNNETPGLGSKATGGDFISQLSTITLNDISQNALVVVKQQPKANNEVQAVSGATISSRGITKGVQAALDAVKTVKGGD
ncbi:MAG: FMN-binding protein [Ruminiclostridium sp.]|nr:FMN-binding protein [Ruminiclostridium sp.]